MCNIGWDMMVGIWGKQRKESKENTNLMRDRGEEQK